MADLWNDLTDLPGIVGSLLLVVATLVLAVVGNRVIGRFLRRAYLRRVDRTAEVSGVAELARVKRQRTLVTLLESLVRYSVYGAALVIILNIMRPGASSAVFSVTLLGVLLGFGLQRLLGDVVAGALLIFEGHFAVGDVVTVHQHNITGTVEGVSLRTTTLRTAGDDRVVILNGGMVSMTRWSYGQREYRIELLVRGAAGEAAASSIVAREAVASGNLWVQPPTIVASEDATAELRRLRIRATISPEHDVVVTHFAHLLEHELRANELLHGDEVLVLPLYEPTFDAWRTGLLVRD